MLEITKLHVNIEEKEIIKGLDLLVKPGEVHAVMGPNGSGKSTLAYTLAGHPSYTIGVGNLKSQISNTKSKPGAWINGEDLLEMAPDERAKAGLFLAFQYPVEVPGVKVDKFLFLAHKARFEEQPEKIIPTMLAFRKHLLKLAEELEVNPDLLKRGLNEGFSGGEKKRLEILQMAVLEPEYAVLDETDSGLDIDAIKAVAKGVKKIVKKFNTGILVITHYQRILTFLKPDQIHVLVNGIIVRSGDFGLVRQLEKEGYKEWMGEKHE